MTTARNLEHRLSPLRSSGRFSPELLTRFASWIETAPDEALYRVNALAFAKAQGLPEREAIDLFVHSARAGIFDFVWGVICRTCKGFMVSRAGLRQLSERKQCGMCKLPPRDALDDGVEVCFTVSPAVRRIRYHGGWEAIQPTTSPTPALIEDLSRLYFSHARSHPSVMQVFRDGVLTVAVVPRGDSQVLRFHADPGKPGIWRVMVPSEHALATISFDAAAPSTAELDVLPGRLVPDELVLRPGPVEIRVHHRSDDAQLVVLAANLDLQRAVVDPNEREDKPEFLSGRRLLTNQSFRELFRTETLNPDDSLQIRALTMLFTDLKASTQLYERVGDLKALNLVRQHFDILRDVVASHDGAVVKTIGDAVMATFEDPVQATSAAVEMHRALARSNPGELQLKIGLHVGPCVAVDSNERLDFFGQTVNIAARVQGLAEGRELVVTDDVLRWPGVTELLGKAGLDVARESAQLKGIEQAMVVHRSRVA